MRRGRGKDEAKVEKEDKKKMFSLTIHKIEDIRHKSIFGVTER